VSKFSLSEQCVKEIELCLPALKGIHLLLLPRIRRFARFCTLHDPTVSGADLNFVSYMEALIQCDHGLFSGARRFKPANAGVIRIKKHFQWHPKHMRCPNVYDATVTRNSHCLASIILDY
jgi:hypothetical protein